MEVVPIRQRSKKASVLSHDKQTIHPVRMSDFLPKIICAGGLSVVHVGNRGELKPDTGLDPVVINHVLNVADSSGNGRRNRTGDGFKASDVYCLFLLQNHGCQSSGEKCAEHGHDKQDHNQHRKKDLEAKRFQNLFHGRSSTDASLKRPV